jgi:ferric-dicitrate binding protein FerR (iron transport regulator)
VLAIGAVLFLGRERKPAGQPLAPVPEVAVAPAPQPPPEAELTQVAGDVRVASAGGEWRAATAGAAVRLGDAVAVGTNSAATVRFGDGSQLRLYARTRLAFDRWNGGKRLEMAGGALDAVVVPQPTNAPMVVETPFAVARVQGTQFRLLSDRASTWLGVREGRVVMVRKADQRAVAVVPQYYAVVGQGVPFGLLSNQCPYWRGRCTAMTGSVYP